MLEDYSPGFNSSIQKFEEMLKTNLTYFFDSQEIECIAQHYIDFGKVNLAKKIIKIGTRITSIPKIRKAFLLSIPIVFFIELNSQLLFHYIFINYKIFSIYCWNNIFYTS